MTTDQLLFLISVGAFGVGVVALSLFLWDDLPNDEDK